LKIYIDTREKLPLTFQMIDGVNVESKYLETGDYACQHKDGSMDVAIFDRKSTGDLFSSFTGENYEREKAKIARAKEAGLRYILAIESPALEVRKGHRYKKDGEWHEVKKSGIAQVRQIMTLLRRGDFDEVWWCRDRTEMAFLIQEYFLAAERIREKA
jgi:ERCC4-type nuclease